MDGTKCGDEARSSWNLKPDKEKSVEKIDGIVATIMALDRCIRNKNDDGSVYDERGILSFYFNRV